MRGRSKKSNGRKGHKGEDRGVRLCPSYSGGGRCLEAFR